MHDILAQDLETTFSPVSRKGSINTTAESDSKNQSNCKAAAFVGDCSGIQMCLVSPED